MKRGPVAILLTLCLIPAAWLTFLFIANRGSSELKIALVVAFLLLGLATAAIALRASGVKRGRAQADVGPLHVDVEFDARDSDEDN